MSANDSPAKKYSAERAIQTLVQLLKEHGIKRVIASPGTTNLCFVASLQADPFFELYSSVDERSAAYMACGMAAETGQPVVITCTGATASRNYMPGLTEAFYSKLPVLAVTGNSGIHNRGQLIPQQLDRSRLPKDIAVLSVDIPTVKDDTDAWLCNLNINKAILALSHNGGGPVHINLATGYGSDFSVTTLPPQRVIHRITPADSFPSIDGKKVAIFIGKHRRFTGEETRLIEEFCECHNAVVFGDHTSGYYGKYFLSYSSVLMQKMPTDTRHMDVLIHLGEVTGDYPSMGLQPKEAWRVSQDGEVKDPFHRLHFIFQTETALFFSRYLTDTKNSDTSYYRQCVDEYDRVQSLIPELPFSNIWMSQYLSRRMPSGCEVHLGILNTLRSWNLFQTPTDVTFTCNVGGFGIDGAMSTTIGASLCNPEKLYYCILGDLAFFYDLNSIANRHVGPNLRIMLINNGRGTEFTNYSHPGHAFGAAADPYIAAAGHFGNKSRALVRHFAEDLGFEYLTAASKEEFIAVAPRFLDPAKRGKPLIFEVFTDSADESDALETMHHLLAPSPTTGQQVKAAIKSAVGEKTVNAIKKLLK